MRRLLAFALVGGLAWRLFGRRGASARSVTLGYADGSSITLEPGSPELERLLSIAEGAVPA